MLRHVETQNFASPGKHFGNVNDEAVTYFSRCKLNRASREKLNKIMNKIK